jgi:hypothetical protein
VHKKITDDGGVDVGKIVEAVGENDHGRLAVFNLCVNYKFGSRAVELEIDVFLTTEEKEGKNDR